MKYKLLLVLATVIWGSSFVMMKDLTGLMNPGWLLAVRFLASTVVMAVVFLRHRELYLEPGHVKAGIIVGLALFAGYYTQTVGLTDTTPGKNAFLTATYCVIVPFLNWFFVQKRPTRYNVVAAFMCLFGIGLISLNGGFRMGFGDGMTLLCAFFYAMQIILMAKYAPGRNAAVLTMWQFVVVGVGSALIAAVFEEPPVFAAIPADMWFSLVYLILVVTVFSLLIQNIGLAHVEPATAGLLLSLESVFGVAFSILLGRELLTVRIAVGFAVVFAAMVVSEYLPAALERRKGVGQRGPVGQ